MKTQFTHKITSVINTTELIFFSSSPVFSGFSCGSYGFSCGYSSVPRAVVGSAVGGAEGWMFSALAVT